MDEQNGASIEKNEETLLTDAKPQPEDFEAGSRYDNETTSTMDSDYKSSDIINKSDVSDKKEVPEMFTNGSGTSVDKNTTYSSVTDVEPQLTEEASQYENLHGTTTSTMDADDDEASGLLNKSKVSECKEVNDVITEGRELAESANYSVVQLRNNKQINRLENKITLEYLNEQIYSFLILSKDKSSITKALRILENNGIFVPHSLVPNITSTSGKLSNHLGNAQLAHQVAKPPNPSVVEDSGFGSDTEITERIQQVMEKQDDENTTGEEYLVLYDLKFYVPARCHKLLLSFKSLLNNLIPQIGSYASAESIVIFLETLFSKLTNQERKEAGQHHPTSRGTQTTDDCDEESNKRIVEDSEKNNVDKFCHDNDKPSIDIHTTTSDIQPITYDNNQLNNNIQIDKGESNQLYEDKDLPNTKITKQYVEPQLTEEASRNEKALGTTSTNTMDADDEASELINKSAVSECKEVNDVITDGRELAEPTAVNDSVVQNRNAANSTVGNAQHAHQSARPPNPSVVEDFTLWSDAEPGEMITEVGSSDPAAGIAVVPQQSINFSAGNTIEKQNDANTTECQSTSHEEESEQRNTDEPSNSQCGTVVPNDTPHLIDKFKDMKLQTDIPDTRVTNDDVVPNVQTYEKFIPEEIGKKSKIDQTYNVQNEPIILDRIKNITKQSIVECDSEETMAQVKELIEKMIITKLGELEELEFGQCHLEKEHLEEFLLKEVLEAVVCKILKLSIGYTKNVTDLIPSYCRIASNYKSTKLSLIFNDLKNEDIEAVLENLGENEEYEEIDMSYNKNIGPVGYENIGKMVKKHGVRAVRLADCDISDVHLHKLFDGMGDAKLEELDISCTNNVTANGFAHIGKQVAQKRIKRLKLSDTQLNFDTLSAFYEGVKGLIKDSEGQQVLLEEIDVSYNSAMEPQAYKVLGSMVKLFGVKKLSLAGCGLKKELLQDFREKMNSENPLENTGQYTKMKSLNARDNTSIGEGIVEIAKIVKECLLEELDISECRLSVNELKDFIKALGNAKLERLYLGEERQFDKYYISQVCNLLPHIKKMVRLKGTVRNNPRRLLQDKLNKLGESELEIKLDDERTLCAQIKDEVPLSNSS